MDHLPRPSCETCRFAALNLSNPEHQILCLRFPPQPFLTNLSRVPAGEPNAGAILGTEQVSLNPVLIKTSWCGEFSSREPEVTH